MGDRDTDVEIPKPVIDSETDDDRAKQPSPPPTITPVSAETPWDKSLLSYLVTTTAYQNVKSFWGENWDRTYKLIATTASGDKPVLQTKPQGDGLITRDTQTLIEKLKSQYPLEGSYKNDGSMLSFRKVPNFNNLIKLPVKPLDNLPMLSGDGKQFTGLVDADGSALLGTPFKACPTLGDQPDQYWKYISPFSLLNPFDIKFWTTKYVYDWEDNGYTTTGPCKPGTTAPWGTLSCKDDGLYNTTTSYGVDSVVCNYPKNTIQNEDHAKQLYAQGSKIPVEMKNDLMREYCFNGTSKDNLKGRYCGNWCYDREKTDQGNTSLTEEQKKKAREDAGMCNTFSYKSWYCNLDAMINGSSTEPDRMLGQNNVCQGYCRDTEPTQCYDHIVKPLCDNLYNQLKTKFPDINNRLTEIITQTKAGDKQYVACSCSWPDEIYNQNSSNIKTTLNLDPVQHKLLIDQLETNKRCIFPSCGAQERQFKPTNLGLCSSTNCFQEQNIDGTITAGRNVNISSVQNCLTSSEGKEVPVWTCINNERLVRINSEGNTECATLDGKNCLYSCSLDKQGSFIPLTCGSQGMRDKWGISGYDTPGNWCIEDRRRLAEKYPNLTIPPIPATTTPTSTTTPPTTSTTTTPPTTSTTTRPITGINIRPIKGFSFLDLCTIL
jgi:hypothetical protein